MKKEENKERVEEGIVTGDHGYDAVDISSGNSSGNAVNAGPENYTKNKKKKGTKIKRKKIKSVVLEFKKD